MINILTMIPRFKNVYSPCCFLAFLQEAVSGQGFCDKGQQVTRDSREATPLQAMTATRSHGTNHYRSQGRLFSPVLSAHRCQMPQDKASLRLVKISITESERPFGQHSKI